MALAPALENNLKILLLLLLSLLPYAASAELYITVIEGLGGNEEFTKLFDEQTDSMQQAAAHLAGERQVKVISGETATREQILAHFTDLNKSLSDSDRLALVLIGHGSFDGYVYKFNVPGPDLTGEDIGNILNGSPTGFQLLVNTSSASGAILEDLKSESRIIITATRNGNERNAPRFGSFFIEALREYSADTNKNESISAEEAFEYANRRTEDFYKSEGRLATEHPQLLGERAGQFNLARLTAPETPSQDPEMARLLIQRRNIDRLIEDLQLRKDEMDNDKYFNELQQLILELSLTEDMIEELEEKQQDANGD